MAESDRHAELEASLVVAGLPSMQSSGAIQEFPALGNGVRAFFKFHERPTRKRGIHPSELGKWCPREYYYTAMTLRTGKKLQRSMPAPQQRLAMEGGSATHNWWQSRIFGPMGILWGKWRCHLCAHLHGTNEAVEKMPTICVNCSAAQEHLWFDEEQIMIPATEVLGVPAKQLSNDDLVDYRIVGHCDGEFRIKSQPNLIAEVKSEWSGGWERRKGPEPGHVIQGLVYAQAKKCAGVLIVYVNKNTYETKSFLVMGVAKTVARIYGDVREVWAQTTKNSLGALARVCPDAGCSRAKGCSFRNQCFNLQ